MGTHTLFMWSVTNFIFIISFHKIQPILRPRWSSYKAIFPFQIHTIFLYERFSANKITRKASKRRMKKVKQKNKFNMHAKQAQEIYPCTAAHIECARTHDGNKAIVASNFQCNIRHCSIENIDSERNKRSRKKHTKKMVKFLI